MKKNYFQWNISQNIALLSKYLPRFLAIYILQVWKLVKDKNCKWEMRLYIGIDLHWSRLREVQLREVSPGLRASSTRVRKGFIRGSNMVGMLETILSYSASISCSLEDNRKQNNVNVQNYRKYNNVSVKNNRKYNNVSAQKYANRTMLVLRTIENRAMWAYRSKSSNVNVKNNRKQYEYTEV